MDHTVRRHASFAQPLAHGQYQKAPKLTLSASFAVGSRECSRDVVTFGYVLVPN